VYWRRTVPGRLVLVLTVLLAAACGGSPPALGRLVEQAVAGGPGRDSGAYRGPDAVQAHEVAGAVLALLAGAEDPEAPDGLRVEEAVDAAGRLVQVVEEDRDDGPVRGWGSYAVVPGSGAPAELVVEVPHPRADRWTEALGPQLFAALRADALLVAGAHRTAGRTPEDGEDPAPVDDADVAHNVSTVFSAVDRAVVGPGTVVLQVHGFDETRRRGSADVILSSTVEEPGPLVLDLADALEDAGFDPCVYDGEDCDALSGTRNTQAAHARVVGATFVHLELAAGIRAEGERRDELIAALSSVLTR
jgi:hypothetical protein